MKITFKYITLSLLAGASLLTSCEDFLDREPLDSVTPDTYLKNESQLAAYAINAHVSNPVEMKVLEKTIRSIKSGGGGTEPQVTVQ